MNSMLICSDCTNRTASLNLFATAAIVDSACPTTEARTPGVVFNYREHL